MLGEKNWKDFWSNQTTPLHKYNDEKWYQLYAEEINLLYKSLNVKEGNILESGCGNGALYDYFDFISDSSYTGVDFSESLLSIFREKNDKINLMNVDASQYIGEDKYSFIFSNGVIQYLTRKRLKEYIDHSLKMLNTHGVLLMANIPNALTRFQYYSGELFGNLGKINIIRGALINFRSRVKHNGIGYWYRAKDFMKYSNKYEVIIFGSLYHPYRFSVALRK